MAELEEAVKSELRHLLNTPVSETDKEILITFNYKGQVFETKFLMTKTYESTSRPYTKFKEDPASGNYNEIIYLRNYCVSIAYTSKRNVVSPNNPIPRANDFFTELAKNDEEEACFKPRLETLGPIKTIDVLQVLKTKLELLFPTEIQIQLVDAMKVNGIEKSINQIMRGGDAYYEKYGYRSELLDPVKKWIRSLEWKDVSEEIKELIRPHVPSIDIDPSTKFTSVMEKIPYEIFNAYTSKPYINLFEKVHTLFLSANGLPSDSYRSIFVFILDKASPQWIEWEKTLLFTGVKEIEKAKAGGSRRKRRTGRSKKSVRRSRKQWR